MVSIIAAIAAGGSIAGLVLGSLTTALLFWWSLRRIGLPVGKLFGDSSIDVLEGNDMFSILCLRDTYESLIRKGEQYGHQGSVLIPILHDRITCYVNRYLAGNSEAATSQEQFALFEMLAGPHEDWRHLDEFDSQRLKSALIHFMTRTLYKRIIPDGDLNTTLLPVDILSTYRRILKKNPAPVMRGVFARPAAETEVKLRRNALSLQYWRALTTYWCTESFADVDKHNLTRPNLMKMGGNYWRAAKRGDMAMGEDDPRMPHLVATEELLIQALSPFFDTERRSDDPQERDLRSDKARDNLRQIMEMAADIGIVAFASPEPNEFFWPPENRRPGCDPSSDDGYLECFGVRNRSPIPGTESDRCPVETVIHVVPIYNDTKDYEGGGGKSEAGTWDWWTKKLNETPGSPPGQATIVERERRLEEARVFREGAPVGRTPGWNGSAFF